MVDNSLSQLFEDSVQVSTEDLTFRLDPGEIDQEEPPGKILIGKLICKGNIGRPAIAGTLKQAWASFKNWTWKEDQYGIIHFTFANKEDAWNVLQRRPWIICGALLVIMPWPSWLSPQEVKFDKSPFYVRIYDIPPFYWNNTNLIEIATKVSPIIKLPRTIDFERGSFGMGTLRFQATVEIDKPLFSGFFMKREGIKDLWIQYKYEKLPKLCRKCDIISHDQKFCFKQPTVIKDNKGAFFPMFGPWMKFEDNARWPFIPDLPKWFQEWIIQKRLTLDPKFRQQWKHTEATKIINNWEDPTSRRQLPSKRRLVEQVVAEWPDGVAETVSRFPMVSLPGVGDICPFEDTTTLTIQKNTATHTILGKDMPRTENSALQQSTGLSPEGELTNSARTKAVTKFYTTIVSSNHAPDSQLAHHPSIGNKALHKDRDQFNPDPSVEKGNPNLSPDKSRLMGSDSKDQLYLESSENPRASSMDLGPKISSPQLPY